MIFLDIFWIQYSDTILYVLVCGNIYKMYSIFRIVPLLALSAWITSRNPAPKIYDAYVLILEINYRIFQIRMSVVNDPFNLFWLSRHVGLFYEIAIG